MNGDWVTQIGTTRSQATVNEVKQTSIQKSRNQVVRKLEFLSINDHINYFQRKDVIQ